MNPVMPIIACGINHKTALVSLREKVVFQPEKLSLYLHDLMTHEAIHEAVLLSTCNRSELYCITDDPEKMIDWFCHQHSISREELLPAWYCYQDQEAVEHMMRVACGLDSMVLGEPQILGQMKDAFSESCAATSVGPQFNRLFQQVFSVAKEVRTNTAIGACPVSIAGAAVNLAKSIFPTGLNQARVLLIGAGDTIQLVLRHLKSQPLQSITIANRHVENALDLAAQYGANAISFSELSRALANVDIVISATGSVTPIIYKEILALSQQPIGIVDIAVPRDVDASVAELNHVTLYSIDDLKNRIQHNLQGREHAAEKARDVIRERSSDFIAWLDSFDTVAVTIRAYRKQIEELCASELAKAKRQLQRGELPAEVLSSFARALTNKLLHHPSVQLRQAGIDGRLDMLQAAQELFVVP